MSYSGVSFNNNSKRTTEIRLNYKNKYWMFWEIQSKRHILRCRDQSSVPSIGPHLASRTWEIQTLQGQWKKDPRIKVINSDEASRKTLSIMHELKIYPSINPFYYYSFTSKNNT